MFRWLCLFAQCKWQHITDIVIGKNTFDAYLIVGLYQCSRCKTLSKGSCGNGPADVEGKEK